MCPAWLTYCSFPPPAVPACFPCLLLPLWLQFPEKMIPKFTLLASRGRDLPIHGDGGAIRR